MVLLRRNEPKLIPGVLLLISLVLILQAAESAAGSSSSSCSCHLHGGAAVRLLQGRRMLAGRHAEVLAKGLLEHVNKGGGDAIGEEEKREVITGPNPLHNRR
ncbi:unnamed protein product [Miscanthus lutarioriparius]|uniref:Uncharacterized protein n=1 Tax=Miscanthus lutarioriparius TaxID=422564 RepID=A0A811MFJ4_9POAL|nr:unnamed protein product [Miscanthus lutarioriparius]